MLSYYYESPDYRGTSVLLAGLHFSTYPSVAEVNSVVVYAEIAVWLPLSDSASVLV